MIDFVSNDCFLEQYIPVLKSFTCPQEIVSIDGSIGGSLKFESAWASSPAAYISVAASKLAVVALRHAARRGETGS